MDARIQHLLLRLESGTNPSAVPNDDGLDVPLPQAFPDRVSGLFRLPRLCRRFAATFYCVSLHANRPRQVS